MTPIDPAPNWAKIKIAGIKNNLPGHLPGRPPVHQTMNDDNRRPVG